LAPSVTGKRCQCVIVWSSLDPALSRHARLPAVLLGVLLLLVLGIAVDPPAGRASVALEVGPGLAEVAILATLYRRLPLSHWVYVGVFLHLLVLCYGGYYTYALTPLGNWAREAFGFARNHYDRVGHVALGVFPAFAIKEILLRCTPLARGGWLTFLVLSVVLAFAAFWELLEWWVALLVASDVGTAFLGSQGDIWDAQWDMLLALVGAAVALSVFGHLHDRSMARVP
jgi:putative membrane protein